MDICTSNQHVWRVVSPCKSCQVNSSFYLLYTCFSPGLGKDSSASPNLKPDIVCHKIPEAVTMSYSKRMFERHIPHSRPHHVAPSRHHPRTCRLPVHVGLHPSSVQLRSSWSSALRRTSPECHSQADAASAAADGRVVGLVLTPR